MSYFYSFTKSVKHWYIPLILGILLIICGIAVFAAPFRAYTTLSLLFALSFLMSGLLDIFFALQNRQALGGWGWYLASGIVSLLMGAYLFANPVVSAFILPFIVGFTLLFHSFQLLGFSFEVKEAGVLNWGNLALLSTLGIIVSFLLIANPIFTGISLMVLIALTFIFSGVASIVLSFNLKKIKGSSEKLSDELKSKIENLKREIKDALSDK
ncbi:MAG: HdeD family acid-resistance protein [Capnocytophaga ochracea]